MIGETKFEASAKMDADGNVTAKVTAITPYGNRSVSVSADLNREAISHKRDTISDQIPRNTAEIDQITAKLPNLTGDDLTEAQARLVQLRKNASRLPHEADEVEDHDAALTKWGDKIGHALNGLIKDLRGSLENQATREASRALTAAMDNEEDLTGTRTVARIDDSGMVSNEAPATTEEAK